MKIRGFNWDDRNIEHIARHNIIPDEVEEVFLSDVLVRKGRDNRLVVYGTTDSGRFLLVVAVMKLIGIIRIITARDMTHSERRYYLREKGDL